MASLNVNLGYGNLGYGNGPYINPFKVGDWVVPSIPNRNQYLRKNRLYRVEAVTSPYHVRLRNDVGLDTEEFHISWVVPAPKALIIKKYFDEAV
jgi:hypothetical protein